MNFLAYFILGSLLYGAGSMLYIKYFRPRFVGGRPAGFAYSRPVLMSVVLCCLLMVVVSWLLGRYWLGHTPTDWGYVFVNSAIGTGVFYFGLCPDEKSLRLPE